MMFKLIRDEFIICRVRYTPLRIEYFPDVILDVVLNEKPPRTTKDVEESRLQALSIQPDDDYIRYGSIICLRHMVTGGYVRSPDFCYKPGSSQFIVYGVRTPNPGQEDWWEVVAPVNYKKDTTGPQEQNLPYGSRVRILHKKYKRWLHSHEVTAPVTKQQEVTTCGCREKLDDNDYWIVEKAENGTGFWRKFRSPIDGKITAIEVQDGMRPSVLWKHIQLSLGDVKHLRAGDRDVHCMVSPCGQEYLPLCIDYFPDVILDVVLNEKPPCTVKDVEERYKSGSPQFVLYGVRTPNPGQDDRWEVVAPSNYEKDATGHQGQKIPYGSHVRILHTKTGRWLHSDISNTSPVSKKQIVTTCGCREKSNDNDYWAVEEAEDGTEFWKASDLFVLRHEATNKYLHSYDAESRAKEIVAHSGRLHMNNMWRARLA
ncbi:hypothetical protein BGX27_001213 [Mortierella sp. AM989]|nr:hypothetical protein BGX27_001213 [Mortierella sp. AM989]